MAEFDILVTQNVSPGGIEYQEKFVNVSKGDLISADVSQDPTVLAAGTDGYVLQRDDVEVTGLKWVEPTTNFWNGIFWEYMEFNVTSSGTVVTGSLEPLVSPGDLTMMFSDGLTILDTDPPKTIILTHGTDKVPVLNYVYIPQSTKVLTVNTTDWPSTVEHIKVAAVLLKSAATTATEGPLKNHNWNDEIYHSVIKQGHLSHITENLREREAKWKSGTEGSLSIVGASTPDDVYVAVTSGVISQLHRHTFPAFDTSATDIIHVPNHFTTPFLTTSNLNVLLNDALGNTLNNRSFSFVLWGVINSGGNVSQLMLNLPIGSYASGFPESAEADANHYAVYTHPPEFQGVAFLIARFIMTYFNDVWTLYSTEPLTGSIPNISAGGGAGGIGAITYLGLTDTESTYISQALKIPQVNAGETALEFTDSPSFLNVDVTGTLTVDTINASGNVNFTGLGPDDTEDHLLAIDDVTGLITKRSVASIIAGVSDVTFGTAQYEIPYTNSALDDFDYNTYFAFTGSALNVPTSITISTGAGAAKFTMLNNGGVITIAPASVFATGYDLNIDGGKSTSVTGTHHGGNLILSGGEQSGVGGGLGGAVYLIGGSSNSDDGGSIHLVPGEMSSPTTESAVIYLGSTSNANENITLKAVSSGANADLYLQTQGTGVIFLQAPITWLYNTVISHSGAVASWYTQSLYSLVIHSGIAAPSSNNSGRDLMIYAGDGDGTGDGGDLKLDAGAKGASGLDGKIYLGTSGVGQTYVHPNTGGSGYTGFLRYGTNGVLMTGDADDWCPSWHGQGTGYTFREETAQSTPGAGYGRFRAAADGKMYYKNSSGTEYDLTALGSSVTIGNTDEIPYSNTGTPGTDFNYSSSFRWTAGVLFTTDLTVAGLAASSINQLVLTTVATGALFTDTDLTWDNTTFKITGALKASGNVFIGNRTAQYDTTFDRTLGISETGSNGTSSIEIVGNVTTNAVVGRVSFHNTQATQSDKRIVLISGYRDGDNDAGRLIIHCANDSGIIKQLYSGRVDEHTWWVNGISELQLTAASFHPTTSGGLTLGKSGNVWGAIRADLPMANLSYHVDYSTSTKELTYTADTSDKKLKKNLKRIETGVIARLKQINGYTFNFNALGKTITGKDPKVKRVGLIAQEVIEVFPEVVHLIGDTEYLNIRYDDFVGILVEGIKEQAEEVDSVKHELKMLKETVQELMER